MRRHAILLAATLFAPAAFAQTSPASSDPIVAAVDGYAIHMSDIQADAQNIPQQLQQLPQDQLFSVLVNQEIDRKALLVAARQEGLEHNAAVAQAMQEAANIKLENAYIQAAIAPAVTDTAVQAAYDQQYAGKPGPAQIDARHILVKTEAEAEDIINQLNHGADFATLAKKYSLDPGASNGGELGWFSQDQMVPAFATAAFALQPGQYTKTPIQTQFGWHIILCEGRRNGPTPALTDVEDQIRQQLADAAIKATLTKVRAKVKVVIYNGDGTPSAPAAPGQ